MQTESPVECGGAALKKRCTFATNGNDENTNQGEINAKPTTLEVIKFVRQTPKPKTQTVDSREPQVTFALTEKLNSIHEFELMFLFLLDKHEAERRYYIRQVVNSVTMSFGPSFAEDGGQGCQAMPQLAGDLPKTKACGITVTLKLQGPQSPSLLHPWLPSSLVLLLF